MPTYLIKGVLSEQGAKGLLAQGFAAREAQFRDMVAAQGATVRGYWMSDQGELVVMLDQEEPWNRATGALSSYASGAWNSMSVWELFDMPTLDAEMANVPDYTPPGG